MAAVAEGGPDVSTSELIGTWVAALLTFCALSFLYKDNPFYKFSEALFVGISAGYGAAYVVHQVFYQDVAIPLSVCLAVAGKDPSAIWQVLNRIVPCVLGIMMLARFFPSISWVSRWPLAFIIGYGTGFNVVYIVQTFLLPQIYGMVMPLVEVVKPTSEPFEGVTVGGVMLLNTVSNVVLFVGVLSVIAYFFFSKPHTGAYGKFTRFGVWMLMLGFGATYGNTVMARMSLLIGRIQFLLYDWIQGAMGINLPG